MKAEKLCELQIILSEEEQKILQQACHIIDDILMEAHETGVSVFELLKCTTNKMYDVRDILNKMYKAGVFSIT